MSWCRERDSAMPTAEFRVLRALLSALPCALLNAETLHAAPAPHEPIVIFITGPRAPEDALTVPAAIDVLDRDDIQRAKPKINLSESLERVPGVVARDRQNHAQDLQISIRGFGARSTFGVRGVRLYTDGIPATMPDGQGQVAHFALESAERIAVLRGPFSALYGNSSGGVIELFTADAPDEPMLRGGYSVGDFGLRRAALSLHTPWGDRKDGDLLADLTHVDTDGYRRHSAAQRRNEQLVLKGPLPAGGRYNLLFNGLDLDALDPQGLTKEQLAGDRCAASQGALTFNTRKAVRQNQIGAKIEQDLSQAHAISLTAHGGRRETLQMLSVPVAVQQNNPLHGGGAIDLERDYYGVDARWRWSAALWGRPFFLTTGLQYEVSDDLRRGYENFQGDQLGVFGALRRDERNRVTGQDVYTQAAWQWSARWHINLGARYSRVRFRSDDRFITPDNPDDSGRLAYSQLLPVLGALYRATPSLSLYANAGGGFETPTSTELAYRSDGLSGLNDELDPARTKNVEIGLRARDERLRYSAALFHSRTEDELVVVANQGGRTVYDNAGVSRRRGIELALSGELSPRWRYATNYTFLDARYLRDFAVCGAPPCAADENLIEAGRHIPGLSRHFGWAELVWRPIANTDIALEGRFVDRLYVNDANSEAAPAYASFDLSLERRVVSGGFEWRGFARVSNLFDREIVGSVIVNEANGRYFEPAPGRNWVVGISLAKAFD